MKTTTKHSHKILSKIHCPKDLKKIDSQELQELASELRELLIDITSKNGGHVSPNLGVVELTIALHRVFNSPSDKIIWDIGHQAYIHKMLTGRWQEMTSIRQYKGICGFCRSEESEHDAFNAGHAATSLSVACGMAEARDQKKEKFQVIPIIGDGSIGSGMALEALNHIGYIKKDMIIIFNDNDWSICQNVGAISNFTKSLEEIHMNYTSSKDIEYLENGLDKKALSIVEKIKRDIYPFIHTPSTVFDKFGFKYLGPFDGHDIDLLVQVLERAKKRKGPQFVHIKTQKGKGYKPAENNPALFHGIGPFDRLSGQPIKKQTNALTFPKLACNTLIELAKNDESICVITPGTPLGTSVDAFQKEFPHRFFDVGIAEQHAVTFAAGLAKGGMKPVVSIYSTFLQRAYDQIVHDVCIQNLPVVFLCRSGLVEDGDTHHGTFDVSMLRHIPNLIVMSPKDDAELVLMIKNSFQLGKPTAIIHPKGNTVSINSNQEFTLGKGEILSQGKDLALLAFGSMVKPALEVADRLMAYGIKTCVINTKFAKHIDKELLSTISKQIKKIITLEEHLLHGGVGSRVLEVLAELDRTGVDVKQIGLPDKFIEHGDTDNLKKDYGLDTESIIEQALNFIGFKKK